jgi:acetylornithine deacetylase/succinyl-diaminopimelate desuccinylase-like protein
MSSTDHFLNGRGSRRIARGPPVFRTFDASVVAGNSLLPSTRRSGTHQPHATRFYGLNYNIPSLCFGASGAAMHGFNEYVDLDSLRKSTKATALFIAEWCGVEAI